MPDVICSPCSTAAVKRYSCRATCRRRDPSVREHQSAWYSSPTWRVSPPLTLKPGGVAQDHVALVHVEQREVERRGPGASASPARAASARLRIEVGDGLLALQAVELGRLRRAESARDDRCAVRGIRQVRHSDPRRGARFVKSSDRSAGREYRQPPGQARRSRPYCRRSCGCRSRSAACSRRRPASSDQRGASGRCQLA